MSLHSSHAQNTAGAQSYVLYACTMYYDFDIPSARLVVSESICSRVIEVVVPGYRVRGETALLECRYELQGDTLYSVKWYKDNEEFYRFMPKLSPPHHSYWVEGVKVDHQLSNDKRVMLKGLTLKSSGMYRCEVSAEAPGFSSANGEGRMEVIYLAKDGPYISGQDKKYRIGDKLNLNCTSGKSYPVSVLHWYVNDEKISNPADLADYGVTRHQHGLETVNLGLRLPVGAHHLKGGSLRARCVASSPWPSSPTDLGRAAPLTDNREALLLGKHPDRIDQPNNPIPKQRPDTKLNPLTQIAHLYISYTSSLSLL
ncbi:uncharacterized protein LOC143921684 [Arctopsyche grandis]|uniref:uncharacterized protein LOC143921684 n=1 Tax=Arctopsyche grandis TaxID=121162 RepID=UPI00406D715E